MANAANMKLEIDWLGQLIQANATQVESAVHSREFTREEYAEAGWPSTVQRKVTCRCPSIRVILESVQPFPPNLPHEVERGAEGWVQGGRWRLTLGGQHSAVKWEGDAESGYRLIVTRVESAPFEGVEP